MMAKSEKIDINFVGTLSSCLEQYVRGKIKPIEVLKLVENSLPRKDKDNWDHYSAFQGFELIESFLEVKGMTQAELARELDLSSAKINDIIKGRRNISPKTARKLAEVFKVDHTIFL